MPMPRKNGEVEVKLLSFVFNKKNQTSLEKFVHIKLRQSDVHFLAAFAAHCFHHNKSFL